MTEEILYEDKNVTVTYRKVVVAQKIVDFAAIRKLGIQQTRDSSSMYRTLMYCAAWGLLCILLNVTPIPTVCLFAAATAGIFWLSSRAWPHAIVADTQEGEVIILSSHDRRYIEKITHILCDRLGFDPPPIHINTKR